jgi:transcriptional regulator with XRE-family HTH domain
MDDDMKINSTTVKRLRTERAWSQDQLAEIASLSLRTIQRVEADGSASAETRMAIAAAFGIDVRDLAPPEPAPTPSTQAAPAVVNPARYRNAALVASVAALSVGSALYFRLEFIPLAFINLMLMTAISTALYAGFGWYFSGHTKPTTPARRTAQFGFVFGAITLAFASLGPAPKTAALSALQMTLFACAIHAAFDVYKSRQAKSQGPGPA